MSLNRTAVLIPNHIQIRIKENSLSIHYKIKDAEQNADLGDMWINFSPSSDLINKLKDEIEIAIKKKEKVSA